MSTGRRLAAIPAGPRTKWLTFAVWCVIGVIAFILAPNINDEQAHDPAAFLPNSAEATQVLGLEAQFRDGESIPAVIVYQRSSGITPADFATAEQDRAAIAELSQVVGPLPPPIPSADGQALKLIVPIDIGSDIGAVTDVVPQLRAIAADDDGLLVRVTGPAGTSGDFLSAFENLNSTLLLFTIIVVTVVLLVTYRSPVLWLVPILAVMVAVQLSKTVNWLLAANDVIVVNGQTLSILLVLVFGAGTDYALLLISRYREELKRHRDRHEAMTEALSRSAGALTASALTVAAALLALQMASLQATRGLGPAGAVGVLCAWIAAITLLPALLVILGRWVFWPFVPRFGDEVAEARGAWARLAAGLARRPRVMWVGTAAVLAVLAGFSTMLDATGLPDREAFLTETQSVEGQELLAAHFEAGSANPLVVIGRAEHSDEIIATLEDSPDVADVADPVVARDLVRVEVTLAVPPEPATAYPVITDLRERLADTPGDALVGGDLAVNADTSAAAARDRRVVIPLVLLVVLAILILLLRSLAGPVMLIATVVLSFFAALGLCTLLFGWLLDSTRGDQNFPLFAFIFLVALGVDYNIFLMTRVREEALTVGTREAVLRALAVTGGVITSAGVVLAATFAVLASLPLTALFQIGITVAVGVLLDTLVVRSVLVPALTLDLGRHVWWPSALSRPAERETVDA
jgi:RND superfamily putative drug exporter